MSAAGQPQQQSGSFSASLYVGDLAPDVSEAKLFEIFNSVGPVTSIRVCRDSVYKRSLGYAYVNFHHHDDADRALETMNYTLINNRPCRIMWSQRDPSLRKSGLGNVFVRNLHSDVQHKELLDAFSVFGNILSCKVATHMDGKSKGYGYVHFESEEAAQEAVANANDIEICGQKVEVSAYQRRERRAAMAEWTNLYVKNIPLNMSEAELRAMFEEFGEITSLKVMTVTEDDVARDQKRATPFGLVAGKSKGFGFVNFAEHEAAKNAADTLNNKEMEGASAEGEEAKKLYVGRAVKKEERQRDLKKHFDNLRQNRIQASMGNNLYVKNLEDTMTDKDLHSAFEQFGTITSARVMRDQDGNSRGFGFVCFSSPEEANTASTEMNNKTLNGKPIFVTFAMRRDQRREMLSNGAGGRGGQMMGRGMQMMYGGMQMMYPNMGGRGQFMQPMMMPRGMPRGPMPAYGRGGPQYQMPMYPNAMMQQQQGNPRRQTRRNTNSTPRGGARQQQGQRQQGQQNIKFTQNARNQPGVAAPEAQPVAQVPPAQAQLTPAALANADPQQQKNMIGEQLYPLIAQTQPEQAGKITGMLLEMDNSELLNLIESPDALHSKITEALEVLKVHQSQGN